MHRIKAFLCSNHSLHLILDHVYVRFGSSWIFLCLSIVIYLSVVLIINLSDTNAP